MRARDVIGKRIIDVEQDRFWDSSTGSWAVAVRALVLEGGARLVLTAWEGEEVPHVEMSLHKKGKASHA